MKYSQLIFPPLKSTKQYDSINASLLSKGSFIHQVMAGVYTYLPLGLRVLNKIEQIVREEMNTIGIEVSMTALAPKKLWETTGRLESVDVLMKTAGANLASQSKNRSEYILNSTHEEEITPLVQQYVSSYKDLPVGVYQIQTKFRNEARVKSGLMRGREFRMKDLYSFHASAEDLQQYYEKTKQVYTNIFQRVGLGDTTVVALASGGDFTTDFSHEFQTFCDTGEDTLFYDETEQIYYNREVTPALAPPIDAETEKPSPLQKVEGKGIIGVESLAEFLHIPVSKTTKTMLFESADGRIIAAAVRGNYEVDVAKLQKVTGAKKLKLASAELITELTGAEVGYAGIINLPSQVEIFFDDSTSKRINFECGANKTDYHAINVNFGRDVPVPKQFYDIKVAQPGDLNPKTNLPYQTYKASEVGNIFPLHTKFSLAFDFHFRDQNGELQPIYMGCYGIGTSRLMGVIAETHNDDKGIIWPESIAPYRYHLISLPGGEEKAQRVYNQLVKNNQEVLWDDRSVSAGEKFADADLIGCPIRLVCSAKTGDQVEVKKRTEATSNLVALDQVK